VNLEPAQLGRRLLLLLGLLTFLCYLPVVRHEFINIDDRYYILQNTHVTTGLTWGNIVWAFTTGYASNWHPLTWLSHMVDCQLFGLNPAGHHLVNALLHSANTLLLFVWLKRATGRLWLSAFVAALFGWHPLHVESVAWASERKDVLSTFFFLLTLIAYARYQSKVASLSSKVALDASSHATCQVEGSREGRSRITHHASFWYCLTLVLFVLGLMSKPMLVTLPFLLLLLDYWPFGRFPFFRPPARMLWEKLPFLALSLFSSIITFLVQKAGGAVSSLETIPVRLRIATSLEAYAQYLFKTIWPERLAAIYAYSRHPDPMAVVGSGLLLLVISALAVMAARRLPFVFTGWFWFLGTLVPVIGLVQVGGQAMADRYMYIPSIGLFIGLVWLAAALLERWQNGSVFARVRPALYGVALVLLIACLARTSFQLKNWQNSELLFRHSLAAAPENYNAFGKALDEVGRKEEALAAYSEAVRLAPRFHLARCNLATVLADLGRTDEAITNFEAILREDPRFADAHHNLGSALLKAGRVGEAREHLVRAVSLKPEEPQVHYSLGTLFLMESNYDGAVEQFSEVLRTKPKYADAHRNLGFAFLRQGQTNQAIGHFASAVQLEPNNPDARFNLGLALLESGQAAEAETQLSAGLRLSPEDTRFHYRLAVALARQKRTEEAIVQYREALRLTPDFPEARSELAALLAGGPAGKPQ
jgi:tetratricopeptide (TPR) repeat protein